jgi:hypothetical protein
MLTIIKSNIRKLVRFNNKNYKEEYMNIPAIYLFGIPLFFGLSLSTNKFLNNQISCNDKSSGNNYRDTIFWSPQ